MCWYEEYTVVFMHWAGYRREGREGKGLDVVLRRLVS